MLRTNFKDKTTCDADGITGLLTCTINGVGSHFNLLRALEVSKLDNHLQCVCVVTSGKSLEDEIQLCNEAIQRVSDALALASLSL